MAVLAGLLMEFLISVVLDVLLVWTGDLVLFVLTLGRLKPGFQPWKKEQRPHPAGFPTGRALVGILFWIALWILLRA